MQQLAQVKARVCGVAGSLAVQQALGRHNKALAVSLRYLNHAYPSLRSACPEQLSRTHWCSCLDLGVML